MLVVGLTGGIASGKSTVSGMFEDAGVPVVCLDELAREVVKPGSPALHDIRNTFGDKVIDKHGALDREVMAGEVFGDDEKRRRLESIIHPRVGEETQSRLRELEKKGHEIAVVDVPLLYEIRWERKCDLVVVVYVPAEIQEMRLIERDAMSPADARSRLQAQMPIEDKKKRADFLVDNCGGLDRTRDQVRKVCTELASKAELREL